MCAIDIDRYYDKVRSRVCERDFWQIGVFCGLFFGVRWTVIDGFKVFFGHKWCFHSKFCGKEKRPSDNFLLEFSKQKVSTRPLFITTQSQNIE